MSKRIDQHTLNVLEYPAILNILAGYAASDMGREAAQTLYPSTDRSWILRRLAETAEMRFLIDHDIRIPLAGMRDIRPILDHLGKKQAVLEPTELLQISDTLSACANLKAFFSSLPGDRFPTLTQFSDQLGNFETIVDPINQSIDGDETVKDDASPKLKEIRKEMAILKAEIQTKYQKIVNNPHIRKALANEQFLTRNGRAVVLVKANYRTHVNGIVLDRSNTGGALYIEPYELVELSNQLEDITFNERREVERILWELTRLIISHRKPIHNSIITLSHIDLTWAKARFGQAYNMSAPILSDHHKLSLRQARHPLLIDLFSRQQQITPELAFTQVVPIDVRLGDDFDLLLLTGPNTGGKTVTLKTIGLIQLMTQSGMQITAWPDSSVPIYHSIFADIGDEQSIQQSLSTFSAHMKQIVSVIQGVNRHSLVLLDELGSGTDPTEGACLSAAILTHLLKKHCHIAATTHLGQLKHFAWSSARAENGSVQFDLETMRPTYHLLIGTPGSSNALAIAQRLGMQPDIIRQAQQDISEETQSSNREYNLIQATREEAERKRQDAQAILDSAEGVQQLAIERLEQSTILQEEIRQQADFAIEQSMKQVRHLVEKLQFDSKNAPAQWRQLIESYAQLFIQAANDTPLGRRQQQFIESLRKGDTVYLPHLRTTGLVIRIRKNRQTAEIATSDKTLELPFDRLAPADIASQL